MASFVVNGLDQTAKTLLSTEYGFIAEGAELMVAGADAIDATGEVQLAVLGNITTFGDFEALDFDGNDIDMFIGESGSVFALSDEAIGINADSRVEITNHGAIAADGTAIRVATSDTGAPTNIFNAGTINGSSAILVNSGSSATYISNTGSMFTNGTTISISSLTGPTTITNSGVIESGGSTAIITGGGNDLIINTGEILGGISMRSGNDTYDGISGVMTRRVDGGNGDDTLLGGDGTETMRGGNDEDYFLNR